MNSGYCVEQRRQPTHFACIGAMPPTGRPYTPYTHGRDSPTFIGVRGSKTSRRIIAASLCFLTLTRNFVGWLAISGTGRTSMW